MKKRFVLLLVVLCLLSACSKSEHSTAGSTEIPVGGNIPELLRICNQNYYFGCDSYLWYVISPDEKWILLTNHTTLDEPYQILSTTEAGIIYYSRTLQSSLGTGFFDTISWSPDSTAIVGMGTAEPILPSIYDRLVIFRIEGNQLESSMLTGVNLFAETVQWSPDGQYIVTVDHITDRLMIIDRNARIVWSRQLEFNQEETVHAMGWIGGNIYFGVSPNGYASQSFPAVLYRIDDKLEHEPEKIFTTPDPYNDSFILGFNEEKQELLLKLKAYSYTENLTETPESNEAIYLLNFQTGEYEEVFQAENISGVSENGNYSPDVMFVSDNQLWIYDWEKDTCQSYGEIMEVFGWLNSEGGFLVEREGENGSSYYEVVKP